MADVITQAGTDNGSGEQTGNNGGQTPPTVDWSTVDINSIPTEFFNRLDWSKVVLPEEAIKSTKQYKDVLQESIDRRKKIRELLEGKEETPPKDEKPTTPSNEKELLQQVLQKLQKLEERDSVISRQSILQKYKVPDEYADMITDPDLTVMETKAKKFSEKVLPALQRSSQVSAGQGDPINDIEGLAKRLLDKMEGKASSDALSADTMIRLGGGPLVLKP